MVYRRDISLTRCMVHQSPEFGCLHLMLGNQAKNGITVGVPPTTPCSGLTARAVGYGLRCDVAVTCQLVLGNFNAYR